MAEHEASRRVTQAAPDPIFLKVHGKAVEKVGRKVADLSLVRQGRVMHEDAKAQLSSLKANR